jgi:hypothetical protein
VFAGSVSIAKEGVAPKKAQVANIPLANENTLLIKGINEKAVVFL